MRRVRGRGCHRAVIPSERGISPGDRNSAGSCREPRQDPSLRSGLTIADSHPPRICPTAATSRLHSSGVPTRDPQTLRQVRRSREIANQDPVLLIEPGDTTRAGICRQRMSTNSPRGIHCKAGQPRHALDEAIAVATSHGTARPSAGSWRKCRGGAARSPDSHCTAALPLATSRADGGNA